MRTGQNQGVDGDQISMSFFSGNATYTRFRYVEHVAPILRVPGNALAQLDLYTINRNHVVGKGGARFGWIAGDHVLDLTFELEKNYISDCLQFAMRVDSNSIPPELRHAYEREELAALAKGNPSGRPSKKQRKEAKENARDRLEEEAKNGKFLRRKMVPVLIDTIAKEIFVGTTSETKLDLFRELFQQTFAQRPQLLSAGTRAYDLAELSSLENGIREAKPAPFAPGQSSDDIAWMPDEDCRDFLGNEFILWLWWQLDSSNDEIKLPDGTTVAAMIHKKLTLWCPKGLLGNEAFVCGGMPSRMPEARRALPLGKLPRKVGLVLVRHSQQYEFGLSAESMAITSLKLPRIDESEERARLEARVTLLRAFRETLDLLFGAFVTTRASHSAWQPELRHMQKWLARKCQEDFEHFKERKVAG